MSIVRITDNLFINTNAIIDIQIAPVSQENMNKLINFIGKDFEEKLKEDKPSFLKFSMLEGAEITSDIHKESILIEWINNLNKGEVEWLNLPRSSNPNLKHLPTYLQEYVENYLSDYLQKY